MSTFTVLLLLATLLNGLLAGVFFTWTNAITPGIGNLSDKEYLGAFQAMNRTILNPQFYVVFFGSIALTPLLIILHLKQGVNHTFWLLLAVLLIYGLGVIATTFLGNIPLNNRLDKTDLNTKTANELKKFRDNYESRWNQLHLIRTITSSASFILLLLICLNN